MKKGCCYEIDRKKAKKPALLRAERFITKKVMAMPVSDVLSSLVMTLPRLNLLLAYPNLPSIKLRILSSSWACFFFDLLIFLGRLPRVTPLILIPLSLHARSIISRSIYPIYMN